MNKNKIKIITLVAFIYLTFLISPSLTLAQNAISLSITPPLLEVLIKPGKEVRQVYNITNNGGDTVLTAKILYFEASDEDGNVNLTSDEAPDWVRYSKEPFKIKSGEKMDFSVLITPSEDTEETDHFLTLLLETQAPTDLLNQNSSFYQTQIGSNILITVSKDGNPKKSADILEFKAPKVIDSILGDLVYSLKLKNSGNSFWKPNGKITIDDNHILKLAGLNLISGSVRNIKCLSNETLVDCRLTDNSISNLFYIGTHKAVLEFTIDDDPKVYKGQVETFSFPFSGLSLVLVLLTIYRSKVIFRVWQKRR